MTTHTDKRLILLNPADNIFVCAGDMAANETIELEGDSLLLTSAVELGHKLARRDIAAEEKILKYGVSIGSAKTNIQRGEHVHLHNIKSDYIPSHIRSGIVNETAGDATTNEELS